MCLVYQQKEKALWNHFHRDGWKIPSSQLENEEGREEVTYEELINTRKSIQRKHTRWQPHRTERRSRRRQQCSRRRDIDIYSR